MSNAKKSIENSDDSDDEPLSLDANTLAALQSVMGSSGSNDLDLVQLLQSRRMMNDDSSSEEEEEEVEEDGMKEGESHADYYKRLYPERYSNTNNDSNTKIEQPIALVTMDDEYVQDLILSNFAKKKHWQVLTKVDLDCSDDNDPTKKTKYDFHWGEYEHIDFFSSSFTSEETIVSCYYNRKGMIRKGNLALILEKWQSKYKGIKKPISPKSYVLRLPIMESSTTDMSKQLEKVIDESLNDSGFPGFTTKNNSNSVFILKPSVTNQANGIHLVSSKSEVYQAISKSDAVQRAGDFVLQQYIEPLLLDKRKFHLRVFLLLHGNITALVYPDFLAIFSLEPYENAPLENTRAHLTNIAHQEILSLEDQHKCMRRFDETVDDMLHAKLVKNEEEAKEKIDSVQNRVYEIIAEMVEAVTSELTFVSKSNCFELFGLDFMIDPDWNVWLLEANAEPDLSKAGDRLQSLIDNMLEDTLEEVTTNNPKFSIDNQRKTTRFVKVFERKGRSY